MARGRKLYTFGVFKYRRNRTDIRSVSEEIGIPPIGQEEHLLLRDHGVVTVSSKLRASAGQRPLSPWNKSQGSFNGSTLSSRRPVRGQC